MNYSNLIHRLCATGALATGMLCGGQAFAADPSVDLALTTAAQWVTLSDAGAADRMWSSSSPFMQKSIHEDEWGKYLGNIRAQLGKVSDRQWNQVIRVSNPANLPPGEYLNVVYITHFAQGLAIEKVSLSPNGSGWTPVGYVVNPVRQGSQPASTTSAPSK
jgi:hypothetical protein